MRCYSQSGEQVTQVFFTLSKGKSEKALAKAGVEVLADFICELGLPTTLKELGMAENLPLEEIASSVPLTPSGYGELTHRDVLDIFQEAMG